MSKPLKTQAKTCGRQLIENQCADTLRPIGTPLRALGIEAPAARRDPRGGAGRRSCMPLCPTPCMDFKAEEVAA